MIIFKLWLKIDRKSNNIWKTIKSFGRNERYHDSMIYSEYFLDKVARFCDLPR